MAKDFSIRYEVKVMLEDMGVTMTEKQIDDIVEAIEQYDTFLGVIGLFVAKGIKEIAERDQVSFDNEEIEHQLIANRKFINYDDL